MSITKYKNQKIPINPIFSPQNNVEEPTKNYKKANRKKIVTIIKNGERKE